VTVHAAEPPTSAPGGAVVRSQAESAYETLREQIVLGVLAPGAFVSERGLVEETGFGKTPVREALARLVVDGFVVSVPRRGYRITDLTLADVDELIDLWRAVGPFTVRRACERDPAAVLRALAASADPMRSDLEAGRALFEQLALASGNGRLVEANERLFHDLYRYLVLAYSDRTPKDWLARDLRAMARALRKGDVDAAVRIYERSIDHGESELHRLLRSLPSLRSASLTA
jgi:DNA-binding GntR family transcriptional regulator